MKHVLKFSPFKDDDEEDEEDEDKEESVKKVPVRHLRKNQPVKKTFSPQGSPGRKQPPRAVKNKQGHDEIEVRHSMYLIF